ncbi:MAG: glycosyltransferase family 2 protein [Microthrixaceae bacterium]|nr:glycosyltransferase family 2 protein [Microthrixaceae bacterium]
MSSTAGATTTRSMPVDARERVDVVIVNYNTADLLVDTLEDLQHRMPDGVDWSVYVADNLSSDDSVERVRSLWPDVHLIEMGENAGFCRGNNAAIREGDAEYVLLVNTDTRLFPDTVERMLDSLRDDPDAAVVGPRLQFEDGRFQAAAGGAEVTLRSYLAGCFGLERFADRFPFLEGAYTTRDHGRALRVGWVSSACMLLRRSAIESVGLMDERIFLYMDDVDLCHRLRSAGWSVWFRGDVRAVHFMSGGSLRKPGTISPHTVDSLVRWFDRTHGGWRSGVLRGAGVVAHGARGGRLALRYAIRRDAESLDRAVMNLRLARYYVHTGVEPPGPAGASESHQPKEPM